MFSLQIPGKIAAIFSIAFTAVCLWFAIDGFNSPADSINPDQASGGRDFAWFWAFLAVVGFLVAWLSWTLGQRQAEDKDA
jgi:hypothetical protein